MSQQPAASHSRDGSPLLGWRASGLIWPALFLSGAAGIINQVTWQRSLKIWLGGSESLSAMIVVVVFLAGLGLGSWWMGRRALALRSPGRMLAVIEVLLFVVNIVVAWVLSLDLSETIFMMQRSALSLGVPIRVCYALLAIALLGIPCFLMGITLPLASEVCQREFKAKDPRLVGRLLFVNTLGAVVGSLGSGFYLIPFQGLRMSLIIAAAGNLAAGCLVLWQFTVPSRQLSSNDSIATEPVHAGTQRFTHDIWLGCALGFLALGYEMILFRLAALLWWPLPSTFATTLCLYLLGWSLGVWMASKRPQHVASWAALGTLAIASVPYLYEYHRWGEIPAAVNYILGAVYFLPCLCFGALYALLIERSAHQWGRDVGRFCAWNTLGACVGVLAFTLIGYEIDQSLNCWIVALGMMGVLLSDQFAVASFGRSRWMLKGGVVGVFAAMIAITTLGMTSGPTQRSNGILTYQGRDGVVEIRQDGVMIWDGLEHSMLRNENQHVGDNNWLMAAIPVLCYSGPELRDVLVIGLGCGSTTHSLSEVDEIESIDVYDINSTLNKLIADHSEETYHVHDAERIHIMWQDGRTGMALNTKQYDLITQQPLYLMQAGSGLLLSQEYFELVRSRLKPGGIFCAYTYDLENHAQSQAVRQTAQAVFPYCESFCDGWMIIASDQPIDVSRRHLLREMGRSGPLFDEIRVYESAATRGVVESLLAMVDRPRLSWDASTLVITDDHPFVEYPWVAARMLQTPVQIPSEEFLHPATSSENVTPAAYNVPNQTTH